MSVPSPNSFAEPEVHVERSYLRFTRSQRWEHVLVFLSCLVLALTGLPQKYRAAEWSQIILATPERVALVRQIHHLAAVLLALTAAYHLGKAIYLMSRRRLPGDIFPEWQDVKDAVQMIKYLLFLAPAKPKFGKFNFEQKLTYWFLFFSLGIMGISGFIIWFPEWFTRFLPGGIVPAAKLAHSTEAITTIVFILIWHVYHVHIERLNLSIFTGRLSEREMREFHGRAYERLNRQQPAQAEGESKQ